MEVLISEREDEVNVILKAAREVSGKTQKQVATETGISTMAYQRYEYDEREPGVRTAIRIAKALNSSVEELFKRTQNKPDGKRR